MSRHRLFLEINQKLDYDDYDDDDYDDDEDYGSTSYTEQYGVSPGTAAQFTFNRDSRENASFADYLNRQEESEIPEETIEDVLEHSSDFRKPPLSDDEEAKLRSCMDEIRNIIGDTIPDSIVTSTVIGCQFNLERSLDTLLTKQPTHPPKGKGDGFRPSSQTSEYNTECTNIAAHASGVPSSLSSITASASHLHSNFPPSGYVPDLPSQNARQSPMSQAMSLQSIISSSDPVPTGTDPVPAAIGKARGTGKMPINLGLSRTLNLAPASLKLGGNVPNKLSLGNLKNLNLTSSATPNPSLSQLAQGHLKGKKPADFAKPTSKPSLSLSLSNLKPKSNSGLHLAAALKPRINPTPNEVSKAEPMEITSNQGSSSCSQPVKPSFEVQSFDEPVNERLIPHTISTMAKILCSSRSCDARVTEPFMADWLYMIQLQRAHASKVHSQRLSSTSSAAIQHFDFMSPSPDDAILAKQKGAFTRTGQRVVSTKQVAANRSRQTPSQATLKKSSVVFHIGGAVKSDDETDSKLVESASQLSLKSASNGAILTDKKEMKTPVSAQLKGIKALIEGEGTKSPSLSRSSSKSKLERLDATVEYEKRAAEGKDLINLVVIGHVDAGKSTLMGHVLYQLGVVSQRQMHRYEMDSKKLGKASFMYAWVLDETEEERSRGVTMDVAQTRFETDKLIINLLDAPGHKDFIPNMITGAAQADCALLVVNATNGEFETGFDMGGQTREHTLLIRSLGVSQLVVAINKMDTVNWSQQRFLEIANKLSTFLRQAGFKDGDISFIPCSGLNGVNLVKPATGIPEFSWYTKTPLITEIENFRPPVRLIKKPLRMCVQDIFKGQGSSFSVAGRMEAGDIQNGDRVLVMPCAEPASVKGILIDEAPEKIGFAGDYITLQLIGIDIQKVHVGCVLCDPSSPIPVVSRFRARLVIFNIDIPITKGTQVIYHSQSLNEPANITRLISQLHKNTGEVLKSKPRCLTKNSTAVVEITLARPQCVELYKDYKDLGRFMLRSEGHTIAAGVVMELCPPKN